MNKEEKDRLCDKISYMGVYEFCEIFADHHDETLRELINQCRKSSDKLFEYIEYDTYGNRI